MAEPMFHLGGKVALVAGGAGLLGSHVCRGLASQGADVVVVDIALQRAESVAEELRCLGVRAHATDESLTRQDSIDAVVARTVQDFGRLDILVDLTVSSTTGVAWDQLSPEEFDRTNRGNLTETFLLARAASKAMDRGGSIVLFASMYGLIAPDARSYHPPMMPNPIEYGIGKAGIVQMAKYLATVLGPEGIRVNTIAPGPFPNPTVQAEHPDFVARLSERVPLGRVGQPAEIVGPVVMLASDESSFMTGQTISVDGGWTLW